MKNKRVVRVLIYDGEADWVDKTFSYNYVQGTRVLPPGTITSRILSEEEYDLEKEKEA